jgi:uncharacterized protein YdeI (YjbR/CyaY-like superfamily)
MTTGNRAPRATGGARMKRNDKGRGKGKDPRVDFYIARAAAFARPILKHLRKLVHEGCPGVEETLKWSMPHFMYHGILCSMAAFKQHCAFGFWKRELLTVPGSSAGQNEAMGQFGRIASLSDLPDDQTLLKCVKDAARLNEAGVPSPTRAKSRSQRRQELIVPDDLRAVLRKDKRALATFEGFSYSNQKEYVQWITEAKRAETRQRRLDTTAQWLAEGKTRDWKYANC